MKIEGIFVPNVTPFDSKGEVDKQALVKLLDFWLKSRVSGIVVNASTGEGPMISRKEKMELIELVRNRVDGRGLVIAGTGAIGTGETLEYTKDAEELGADASLLITPFFFKPTEDELFNHFKSITSSVDLPVIIYNVPKFTGYSIPPRVVERIATECSNIVGIKDSSSNPGYMAELIRLTGSKINVMSGAADMTMPALVMGGKGAILAVANVIPGLCVSLFDSVSRGALKEAGRSQLLISFVNKVLVREHSQVPAIKAALKLMNLQAGIPRPPLRPLSSKEEKEISEALISAELLCRPNEYS